MVRVASPFPKSGAVFACGMIKGKGLGKGEDKWARRRFDGGSNRMEPWMR